MCSSQGNRLTRHVFRYTADSRCRRICTCVIIHCSVELHIRPHTELRTGAPCINADSYCTAQDLSATEYKRCVCQGSFRRNGYYIGTIIYIACRIGDLCLVSTASAVNIEYLAVKLTDLYLLSTYDSEGEVCTIGRSGRSCYLSGSHRDFSGCDFTCSVTSSRTCSTYRRDIRIIRCGGSRCSPIRGVNLHRPVHQRRSCSCPYGIEVYIRAIDSDFLTCRISHSAACTRCPTLEVIAVFR